LAAFAAPRLAGAFFAAFVDLIDVLLTIAFTFAFLMMPFIDPSIMDAWSP
jgi:hypothetical protein